MSLNRYYFLIYSLYLLCFPDSPLQSYVVYMGSHPHRRGEASLISSDDITASHHEFLGSFLGRCSNLPTKAARNCSPLNQTFEAHLNPLFINYDSARRRHKMQSSTHTRDSSMGSRQSSTRRRQWKYQVGRPAHLCFS